jgi:hypothetical protein
MQRLWSSEELAERWSLGSEELVLLPGKPDAGKLGLAVQLAIYKQYARDFPKMNPTSRPRFRGFCLGRDDGEPRRRRTGHPPVTLICRETAGRL